MVIGGSGHAFGDGKLAIGNWRQEIDFH